MCNQAHEKGESMSQQDDQNATEQQEQDRKAADRGLAERDEAYVRVRRSGGSPRQAVRAYCAGNQWATENAKGVGNW